MSTTAANIIRVIQIWDYYLPLFSGAAIRHNQLSPHLRAQGINVQVLTRRWEGTAAQEMIGGIPIYRVSHGLGSNDLIQEVCASLSFCQELWARREHYDVVHSLSNNVFRIPVFVLAKLLGKPVILEFTLMNGEEQSFLVKALDDLAYCFFRHLDAYVGLSMPLTHDMVGKGFPSSKCYLIPGGVDPSRFAPLEPEPRLKKREELGLKKEACYLVFVGNLLHRKGTDILVEMMGSLLPTHDNVHLIVLGAHTFPLSPSSQRFADCLKQRISDESLESHIHLVGRVEPSEVPAWLQVSDIFVFPSRREGLPRAVLQAMSIGLPCVCSSMQGIANDIIEPNINGIIVEDYQPTTFARQVAKLITDSSLRSRLGVNARQSVIDRFDEKQIAAKYRRLYEKVLASFDGSTASINYEKDI